MLSSCEPLLLPNVGMPGRLESRLRLRLEAVPLEIRRGKYLTMGALKVGRQAQMMPTFTSRKVQLLETDW